MTNERLQYRKEVAFINREKELAFLEGFINERPESIIFLHGPKSSGKTILLYKFLEQIEKEQKLDVKFLNLRKILTEFDDNYNYRDFLNILFGVEDKSDGYFLNTVYTDSKLKKTSKFYKIDYLSKEDVMEWLLNLEKYSKIKDYSLTTEDAEKVWDVVGGSMWEIQDILSQLFEHPIDDALDDYKQKMLGQITYYIVQKERKKREKILSHFIDNNQLWARDTNEEDEALLKDMVTNNILYFDPTRAVYYPQGKSYHWGIRLYFESIS